MKHNTVLEREPSSLTRKLTPFIKLTTLMTCNLFLLSGCYFFGTISEEATLIAPLLDGQSFSGNEVVLQVGQTMALEFVVSKNDKPKSWKVSGESLDPDYAGLYDTREKNQFVIAGVHPGNAELRFRVSDKRWYTRRKVYLQVTVTASPHWTPQAMPSPETDAAGGYGGAN